MSVKFVRSSDNKYVQYRYMSSSTADADFTNVANWQGVDDKLYIASKNHIENGAVASSITTNSIKIDGEVNTSFMFSGNTSMTFVDVFEANKDGFLKIILQPFSYKVTLSGTAALFRIAKNSVDFGYADNSTISTFAAIEHIYSVAVNKGDKIQIADRLIGTLQLSISTYSDGLEFNINERKKEIERISNSLFLKTDIRNNVSVINNKRPILYTSGEENSGAGTIYDRFVIPYDGTFDAIKVKVGVHIANTVAIAFYNSDIISADSYIQSSSVLGTVGGIHEYIAFVPDGTQTIVVENNPNLIAIPDVFTLKRSFMQEIDGYANAKKLFFNKPLRYSDGTSFGSNNFSRYIIKCKHSYRSIKAYVACHVINVYAIGFYSKDIIDDQFYMGSVFARQAEISHGTWYEAPIPDGTEMIVVQNYAYDSELIEPKILLYSDAIENVNNNLVEGGTLAAHLESFDVTKRLMPYSVGTPNNVLSQDNQYERFCIAMMTDSHIDLGYQQTAIVQANYRASIQNIKDTIDFVNKCPVNISALLEGGDILSYSYANKDIFMNWAEDFFEIAKQSGKPFLFVKGNHDMNEEGQTPSVRLDDTDWANLYGDYAAAKYGIIRQQKVGGGYHTWYYKDFTDYKVRVICLDINDADKTAVNGDGKVLYAGANGFYISNEQFNWIANTALNFDDKAEKDWGVILFTHYHNPDDYSTHVSPAYQSDMDDLNDMLQAFNNHSIYTKQYTFVDNNYFNLDVSADWTAYAELEQAPYFIAIISGHRHTDGNEVKNGINNIYTLNGYCGTKVADARVARIEGTSSQNAFDIFIFDLKTKKIRTIRYGAGKNCYGNGGDRFLPDGLSY